MSHWSLLRSRSGLATRSKSEQFNSNLPSRGFYKMLLRLTQFEQLVLLSCIYLLTLDYSWLLTCHLSLVELELLGSSCICLLFLLKLIYIVIWWLFDDLTMMFDLCPVCLRSWWNRFRLDKASTLGATAASSPVSCQSLCLEVEELGWQINWLAWFTCWSWKDQVLHLGKFWIVTPVACAWASLHSPSSPVLAGWGERSG